MTRRWAWAAWLAVNHSRIWVDAVGMAGTKFYDRQPRGNALPHAKRERPPGGSLAFELAEEAEVGVFFALREPRYSIIGFLLKFFGRLSAADGRRRCGGWLCFGS